MTTRAEGQEYVPMKTGFPVEDIQLKKSQTFPRFTNLKDSGVDLELNMEQEIEYMKCAQDPVYFAKNYYKITSIDKGFILFDPFPYQEELLNAFHDHRFVIDVQCRQSGKTTVVGAFLAWFVLFNEHKEVFVLANKEKQALEILTRVRKAILDLPYFLMRGVTKFGAGEVEFDNGSKVVAYATSSDSIRGRSAALLYIDEVAFIENDMEFWESTFPAVSQSETSRIIMTSTPKGQRGLLYKTWMEADPDEQGKTNEFHKVMVTWHNVPTYCKDPDWKDKKVKALGESRFKQEYECNFKGSIGTLIKTKFIEQMVAVVPNEDQRPDEWTKIYSEYDSKRKYVAVADIGGGVEQDYSVCRILDVTEIPYRTAALYRNNAIDPLLFPHVVKSMCEEYGECWVLPERNNDMGGEFTAVLTRDLEYEYVLKTGTKDEGSGTVIGGSNRKAGLRTNAKTKAVGCSNLKSLVERGVLLIEDNVTIHEIGNFIAVKDSYAADEGCHDDCVMTLVLFGWLVKQRWFQEEFSSTLMTHISEQANKDGTLGRVEAYTICGVSSGGEEHEVDHYAGIPVYDNAEQFFGDAEPFGDQRDNDGLYL